MPASCFTYLWLLSLPRVGRKTAIALGRLLHDPSEDEVGDALKRVSGEGKIRGFRVPDQAGLMAARDAAHRVSDACSEAGIQVHGFDSPTFPRRLRGISDPPAVIFTRGAPGALSTSLAVAVVGTRRPSDLGLRTSHRIGWRLPSLGAAVINGLALGCDVAALSGCAEARGVAVAVLAHGLHVVNPAANRTVAKKLVEGGGCLVSEYAPGVGAQRQFFVDRDRLQSGLADAVIVIETQEVGGTMHTVEFARQQGRSVACLVHSAPDGEDIAPGNRLLLRSGARPLRDLSDLTAWLSEVKGAAALVTPEERGPSDPGGAA